jgi:hypothetical protein
MIESRDGFFEASRHILAGMQKLMTEKLVLSFPQKVDSGY